ncbi:uncharacterized protein LOC120481902 [Pimephales promelas]|uniref:uncharacterized protein LOC120481902 n=1 Tax=Pimephales promelas TaxID=90988 RepID=UPI0019557AC9|nr:uncharacterized protein LOC120481902 [Pimephales promelas]
MGGFVLSGCHSVKISRIWPRCLRALPPPEARLVRGRDVRSVSTLSQMQPLTGALACGKGHLQSIPLERKLCFGLCHCVMAESQAKPPFSKALFGDGYSWVDNTALVVIA